MKCKRVKIWDIDWDTDGEDIPELPKEITLQLPEDKVDEDEISDYLSDTYGFCHNGFEFEVLD